MAMVQPGRTGEDFPTLKVVAEVCNYTINTFHPVTPSLLDQAGRVKGSYPSVRGIGGELVSYYPLIVPLRI